jgi:enoyl-[acyl-carrier protein] reductase I
LAGRSPKKSCCQSQIVIRHPLFTMAARNSKNKVALIMGVANKRSIAWACVESFLRKQNYDCILTFQSERFRSKVDTLVDAANQQHANNSNNRIIASLPCNVETDLPNLFQDMLPEHLEDRKIDAIVHSIAFANFEGHADRLSQASWQAFAQAQHVSAYSFLETARCAVESNLLHTEDTDTSSSNTRFMSSLTALSYIGATRSVPNYHIMGPAKASLEAIVRGLAAELGPPMPTISHDINSSNISNTHSRLRVNCVSAGPIQTAAARGIPGFRDLAQHADLAAPTGNPTVDQVADVVTWVADSSASAGVTGQTIHVDGGYSTIVPVPVPTSV